MNLPEFMEVPFMKRYFRLEGHAFPQVRTVLDALVDSDCPIQECTGFAPFTDSYAVKARYKTDPCVRREMIDLRTRALGPLEKILIDAAQRDEPGSQTHIGVRSCQLRRGP